MGVADAACITLAGGVDGCGGDVAACAAGMIAGTMKVWAEATDGTTATAIKSANARMVEVSIIELLPS